MEWTGQSMSSLPHIADDISRWAGITVEASVGALRGWLSKLDDHAVQFDKRLNNCHSVRSRLTKTAGKNEGDI